MDTAKYIGRVGALAVALASAPLWPIRPGLHGRRAGHLIHVHRLIGRLDADNTLHQSTDEPAKRYASGIRWLLTSNRDSLPHYHFRHCDDDVDNHNRRKPPQSGDT